MTAHQVGFEVWVRWQAERDDYAGRLALQLRRTGQVDYDSTDAVAAFAEYERFMSIEGVREWCSLPDAERDRMRRLFNTVGMNIVGRRTERRMAERQGCLGPERVRQLEMF